VKEWGLIFFGLIICGLIYFIHITRSENMRVIINAAYKIEDTHKQLMASKAKYDNAIARINKASEQVESTARTVERTVRKINNDMTLVFDKQQRSIKDFEKRLRDMF